MQKVKQKYLEIIKQIEKICSNNEVSAIIENQIFELKSRINNYKILLPLVGNFNAGKTSLINSFLGTDLLPTDIRPETTIATEISSSNSKEIIAYKDGVEFDTYGIEEINSIDANSYQYIVVPVENKFLENNPEIIFVDMPGLDSGLSIHNKAIMQYIKNGVSFIVVLDVEDGSIRQSTLNFLKEIHHYNLDLFILINKIDKKPPEEIKAIQDSIKRQASRFFEDPFVGLISAVDNNIDDFYKIVERLDKAKLFRVEFEYKLLEIIDSIMKGMKIRISSLNIDTSTIDKTIRELEHSKSELNNELEEESARVSYQLTTTIMNNILNEAKQNLMNNSSTLISAIQTSQDSFKTEVNELLRPILITATEENIKSVFQDTLNNIQEVFNKSTSSIDKLFEISKNKSPGLYAELDKISGEYKPSETGYLSDNTILSNKIAIAYKSIASIVGITTSIVAPWLEIVILFLPEIIAGLKALFGGNQQDKLRQRLNYEIIPQIISKLRPQVKEGLQNAKRSFFKDLQVEVEMKQQELVTALEKAKQEKTANEAEINKKCEALKFSIEELSKLSTQIRAK